MTKQRFTPAYPAELRESGVRLFRENRADYASDTADGRFETAGLKSWDDADLRYAQGDNLRYIRGTAALAAD